MNRSLQELSPLVLRLMLGFGFVYHGIPKVFDEAGHQMFVGMLTNIGVPAPALMAWAIGLFEFVGGLALIAGAFTSIVSALAIANMLVATFTVHAPAGFSFINIVGSTDAGPTFGMPGTETPLLYAAGFAALFFQGAGALSVDRWRAGRTDDWPAKTPRPIDKIAGSGIAALWMLLIVVAPPAEAQLPDPGMEVERANTALVITDPQIDFLSPDGVTWGVVGESVKKNGTVANLERLLKQAKRSGYEVFVSPHYYYPTDHDWKFEGALEKLMHEIGMFDRKGALTVDGFEGSGADWLARYKPYIEDGNTVVTNPHKVFGPEANDLVLQLRKRGIDRVILAGMSGNLCVESHLRELLEQGFEVAVVTDATASAILPDLDGNLAAQTNFRFLANATWSTDEAVGKLR